MRTTRRWQTAGFAMLTLVAATTACGTASRPSYASRASLQFPKGTTYLVYWDQNEESDVLAMPSGLTAQLVAPWDTNGQICVFPDKSGRFTVGYNPTLPNQRNPGGLKPHKFPPIGEEVNGRNGAFAGLTLTIPGQHLGGDVPGNASNIAAGSFNNDASMTGCVFDRHGDLLAADLGTAQGTFPIPTDGRLLEWFAPGYRTSCILTGPASGGNGSHHVDGTGGLSQPGTMALADNGDILLPNAGTDQVLRIDATSLPTGTTQCPGGIYPTGQLHTSIFFQGNGNFLPFPAGIAHDPTCDCFAVSSYFGNPSIAFLNSDGSPDRSRAGISGPTVAQLADNPYGYNPFGLAFAPDGTLYFIDIHLTCPGGNLANCGPADYGGRLMRVTFAGGVPSTPSTVAGGFDFPISATVCLPSVQLCPYPSGPLHRPSSGPSENSAPARGPAAGAVARPGFG